MKSRSYFDSVEHSVLDNVSNFWKYVNTKRGGHNIPGTVHLDQTSASSHVAAADLFAQFFGSVYNPPAGITPVLNPGQSLGSNVNIHSMSVHIGQIYSALESLDTARGPGFDGIPPLLLRECRFVLSRPLWHIFNASLSMGIFPAALEDQLSYAHF